MKLHVRGVKQRRQRAYERLSKNYIKENEQIKAVVKANLPVAKVSLNKLAEMNKELLILESRGCKLPSH